MNNTLAAALLGAVLLVAAANIPQAHAGEQIDIKGKVAVITGASRGIGLAVAQHLAKKGVKVLLTARSTNDLERESNALNAQGFETAYIKHDVTKPTDHAAAFAYAFGKWGQVDFVFANAGYAPLTTEDDDVKRALDINVYGVILTLNYALPYLKKSDAAAIVYCSSIAAGFNAAVSQTVDAGLLHPLVTYTATKAAVDMVSRTSSGLGIRTYGLNPGTFDTYMLQSMAKDLMGNAPIEATAGFNPIFKESVGDVRDLAPVVEAFFDNSTLYRSGQNVVADNDATFSTHEFYKNMELGEFHDIDYSKVNNFRGEPYSGKLPAKPKPHTEL